MVNIQWTLMTQIFVSGCTLFGLAAAGAMGTVNVNLVQCLVFSGLIVAVDPVAVSLRDLRLTTHTLSQIRKHFSISLMLEMLLHSKCMHKPTLVK